MWRRLAKGALRRATWVAEDVYDFAPRLFSSRRNGLSRRAVRWAYRLFLDREPESSRVIAEKLRDCATPRELRVAFLGSGEYVQSNPTRCSPAVADDAPRMEIEEVASESDLPILLSCVQDAWQHLGETEPHWSVLTNTKFMQDNIERTRGEFFASGRGDVAHLFSTLDRNGVDHRLFKTCLEYGCGLGRVTHWLAQRFEAVYAYDISRAHMQSAENYLKQQSVANVAFRQVHRIADVQVLPKVDVVYSIIVLQHNPPPVIRLLIREFLRALNPGGVAFFQVLTYRAGYRFSVKEYIQEKPAQRGIEMHVLPQRAVFQIAREEGVDVLEVVEDGYTGFPYGEVSSSFLMQKPSGQ